MASWRTLTCIFLALVSFYPAPVRAQADQTSRSWNQPIKPYRVIGNVYHVGASEVTTFLIVTPKGHILLDSGFSETVPQIRQNVVFVGSSTVPGYKLIGNREYPAIAADYERTFSVLKKLRCDVFLARIIHELALRR